MPTPLYEQIFFKYVCLLEQLNIDFSKYAYTSLSSISHTHTHTHTALVVGLREVVYNVDEDVGFFPVFIEVKSGTVERDVVVSLSTSDGTAEGLSQYYIHLTR